LVQVNPESSTPWQTPAKARAYNSTSNGSRDVPQHAYKLDHAGLDGKPMSPERCFQTELTDEAVQELHEQIRAQVADLREKALSAAADASGDRSTQVITAQLPVSPVADEIVQLPAVETDDEKPAPSTPVKVLPEAADDGNVGKLPVSSLNGRSAPGSKFFASPQSDNGTVSGGAPTPASVAKSKPAERSPVLDKPRSAAKELAVMASAPSGLVLADPSGMGDRRPEGHERHLIESALYKIFSTLEPQSLETIVQSFREWKLPSNVAIVLQNSPITTGPGLSVLVEGVVDVLHCPKGTQQFQKVCTYDRCGQLFGELELIYDAPRPSGTVRKSHWATVATRVSCTLWSVDREKLITTMRGLRWADARKAPTALQTDPRELTSV